MLRKMMDDIGNIKNEMRMMGYEVNLINKTSLGDKPIAECLDEMKEMVGRAEAYAEMVYKVYEMEKRLEEKEDRVMHGDFEGRFHTLVNRLDNLKDSMRKIGEQCLVSLRA